MITYRDSRNGILIEVNAHFLFLLVGYIQIKVISKNAEIKFFSVHKLFRGHGIGRKLLNIAVQHINNDETDKLYVYPHPNDCISNSNISIKELYRRYLRLGFRFTNQNYNIMKLEEEMLMTIAH